MPKIIYKSFEGFYLKTKAIIAIAVIVVLVFVGSILITYFAKKTPSKVIQTTCPPVKYEPEKECLSILCSKPSKIEGFINFFRFETKLYELRIVYK